MRAIQYEEFGGYDRLRLTEIPAPTPRDGQALVRMRYVGVSPLDDTIRSGQLPFSKPLPIIPGGGGVGHIVEPGASSLSAGRPVLLSGAGLGLMRDGTWCEFVTADPEQLIPLPDGLPEESASGLSTGAGYLTAYLTLTELVSFKPGQTLLSPGIGGSVGLGSVEVAKALGASLAISTASRTDKARRGREEGHDVIDLSQEKLRDGVNRLTGGRGVDVVIDGVGGEFTGDALASLAPGGVLVSVGYSGAKLATINITDLIWRTAHLQGFMFSLFSPETIRAANTTLLNKLAQGTFHPVIARRFPLEDAAEAQRHLIEDRPYGRVVLEL
jgi:NADPH2:quinone reductase